MSVFLGLCFVFSFVCLLYQIAFVVMVWLSCKCWFCLRWLYAQNVGFAPGMLCVGFVVHRLASGQDYL